MNSRLCGFTLVEILIVVAVIALLAMIAVPNFLRARKRSQAVRVLDDLRMIDSAIDQYAIETNKTTGASVGWDDIVRYLKTASALYHSGGKDLFGNDFPTVSLKVDALPDVPPRTKTALSEVAPSEFWSPFK